MNRDDIIRLALDAHLLNYVDHETPRRYFIRADADVEEVERFAAHVAAQKEAQMIRDGWRQCAEGQRTTQYCGLLDSAVKAEREACAKTCEEEQFELTEDVSGKNGLQHFDAGCRSCAEMIRKRGEV